VDRYAEAAFETASLYFIDIKTGMMSFVLMEYEEIGLPVKF